MVIFHSYVELLEGRSKENWEISLGLPVAMYPIMLNRRKRRVVTVQAKSCASWGDGLCQQYLDEIYSRALAVSKMWWCVCSSNGKAAFRSIWYTLYTLDFFKQSNRQGPSFQWLVVWNNVYSIYCEWSSSKVTHIYWLKAPTSPGLHFFLSWFVSDANEYFVPIVSNVANSYRLQEECDVWLGTDMCGFHTEINIRDSVSKTM